MLCSFTLRSPVGARDVVCFPHQSASQAYFFLTWQMLPLLIVGLRFPLKAWYVCSGNISSRLLPIKLLARHTLIYELRCNTNTVRMQEFFWRTVPVGGSVTTTNIPRLLLCPLNMHSSSLSGESSNVFRNHYYFMLQFNWTQTCFFLSPIFHIFINFCSALFMMSIVFSV